MQNERLTSSALKNGNVTRLTGTDQAWQCMPAIPNTWEAYEFKAHLGHMVGGRGKDISQYGKLVLIKLRYLGILVILLYNLLVLECGIF